jgi:SAM-dependent methyltransferase
MVGSQDSRLSPPAERPWQHHWNHPHVVDYLEERFEQNQFLPLDQKLGELLGYVLRQEETFLDVGCQMGTFYERKQPFGFKYTGVDVTPNFVERCRVRYPEADFRVDDGFNLSFEDGRYDVVFNKDILRHLENPEVMVSELLRVARRQVIVVTYLHPDHPTSRWEGEMIPGAEGYLVETRNQGEFERMLISVGFLPTAIFDVSGTEDRNRGTHYAYLLDKAMNRCREGEESFTNDDWGAARRAFEEALSIDAVCAEAMCNLGMVDLREAKWESAAENFANVVDLRPRDLDFLEKLAVADFRSGRTEKARTSIDRCLALTPGDEDAIAFRNEISGA